MRVCACACSISASACFSSDCFSWIVRCSVDGSNCTTTSPGLTIVPFFASFRICSSPDCIGDDSTIDFSGRISPRISRVSTNVPFVTTRRRQVGHRRDRRAAANAPAASTLIATTATAHVPRTPEHSREASHHRDRLARRQHVAGNHGAFLEAGRHHRLVRVQGADGDRPILEAAAALHAHERAVAVVAQRIARHDDRARRPRERDVERGGQIGHQVRMGAVHVHEHDEVADLRARAPT